MSDGVVSGDGEVDEVLGNTIHDRVLVDFYFDRGGTEEVGGCLWWRLRSYTLSWFDLSFASALGDV